MGICVHGHTNVRMPNQLLQCFRVHTGTGHIAAVSEPAIDACSTALTAVLFQDLKDKLRELDPELAKIFELLYDGESQCSIAKIIGVKSQSSVESKIGRMRRILQQYVTREDILG